MIVFEERLGELIELLPVITDASNNDYKPRFMWGTQDVLNKFLTLQENQSKYPLIWLVNGEDNYDMLRQNVRRDVRLIIATHSDKADEFNPLIYETDYKLILNPVLDNILKALKNSSISYLYDREINIQRLPNYSVNNNGNGQLDIWNAIVLDCSVDINNQCLQPIKF